MPMQGGLPRAQDGSLLNAVVHLSTLLPAGWSAERGELHYLGPLADTEETLIRCLVSGVLGHLVARRHLLRPLHESSSPEGSQSRT
jgi:hypothetical protein